MVGVLDFKYDDTDIISDSIINFYESLTDKSMLDDFINLYISDKKFFDFIQKNFLINKIDLSYLLRLFNDYEDDHIIDEYDSFDRVTTTRWI